ncbi:MAG TPA: hypothetical protein VFS66_13625 [Acidimicrobiia bacterium]|nr:hypothetical protein [Acidimicrobiia bacterium]
MTHDGELPPEEDFPIDFWDGEDEPDQEPSPAWRRPVLIGVALVTALALAVVPIYNVLNASNVAENGLETCSFDYCVVEEAVREAGLGSEMSRLFNTILTDEEAVSLAGELFDFLDLQPVELLIVDDLEGRIGGVYDPESRLIVIERPARAWTVLHEVAHVRETGHDPDFQRVVIELTNAIGGD